MGFGDVVRRVFSRQPAPVRVVERAVFSGPVLPVDQLLTYMKTRAGQPVTRDQALSVPAVKRGRDVICSIATLPLQAVDAGNKIVERMLFDQVDPNVANPVMLAMTVEDLLFESVAWWRVVGFDDRGMPARCVRYAPEQVTFTPPKDYQRGYLPSGLATEPSDEAGHHRGPGMWMGGEWVPADQIIRFDSPNSPLLTVGSRAIGRAIALDDAALMYAENPRGRGYFRPTTTEIDIGDEETREQAQRALDGWHQARRSRVDGLIPGWLEYIEISGVSPHDLQLVAMQDKVSKDIAVLMGLDAEDVAVNTTTRVYANLVDRTRDRVNTTLAPYMSAITARLSMDDVTPAGERVRFDLSEFLRPDPKTRAEVQEIYARVGATDAAEIREDEGRPARNIALRPASPAPAQQTGAAV